MKILNITITNLFGADVEKELMFHLTSEEQKKVELDRKAVDEAGDLLKKSIDEAKAKGELNDDDSIEFTTQEQADAWSTLLSSFRTQLCAAYGYASDDGLSFIKTPEQTEEFSNSIMPDQIIDELLTRGEDELMDFFVEIYPVKQQAAIRKEMSDKISGAPKKALEGHKKPSGKKTAPKGKSSKQSKA